MTPRESNFAAQLAHVRANLNQALAGLDSRQAALIEKSLGWDASRFFEEGQGAYRVAVNHAYTRLVARGEKQQRQREARVELATLGRKAQAVIASWQRLSTAERERLVGLDLLRPLFESNYRDLGGEARDVWFGQGVQFSSTYTQEDVEAVFNTVSRAG